MKKLYRSRDERMIAGVAGGIAEYLNVDPTLVRLLFVASTLVGGWGLVLYAAMAIIVPLEPVSEVPGPFPAPGSEAMGHIPSEEETRREAQETRVPEWPR